MRSEEENALEFTYDVDGIAKKIGYVNRAKMWRDIRREREQAMQTMAPFIKWVQAELGLTPRRAESDGALVWRCLKDTVNKPMEFLGDPTQPYASRTKARQALRQFAMYLLDQSKHNEEKVWARTLVFDIARLGPLPIDVATEKNSWALKEQKTLTTSQNKIRPLTEEQYEELMSAWRSARSMAHATEARQFIGVLFLLTGASWENLLCVSRELLTMIRDRGYLPIPAAGKTLDKAARVLPVRGLDEEVDRTLKHPLDWSILADLVHPHSIGEPKHMKLAVIAMTNAFKRTIEKTGVELEKGQLLGRSVAQRLAVRALRKRNLPLAAAYLGIGLASRYQDQTIAELFTFAEREGIGKGWAGEPPDMGQARRRIDRV